MGKLTEEDVTAIRQAYRDGMTYAEIAHRWGLHTSAVYEIVVGIRHKRVAGVVGPHERKALGRLGGTSELARRERGKGDLKR